MNLNEYQHQPAWKVKTIHITFDIKWKENDSTVSRTLENRNLYICKLNSILTWNILEVSCEHHTRHYSRVFNLKSITN